MCKCFVIVLLFAVAFIAFSDTAVLSSGIQVQQPQAQVIQVQQQPVQQQPVVVQQQQPQQVIQVQQQQPQASTVMMSTAGQI